MGMHVRVIKGLNEAELDAIAEALGDRVSINHRGAIAPWRYDCDAKCVIFEGYERYGYPCGMIVAGDFLRQFRVEPGDPRSPARIRRK